MSKLNDYSQRFANRLFGAFPEWRQFVLAEAPDIFAEPVEGCLIVKVPSPVRVSSPEFGNWMLIDTCGGEVTITYDYYHEHFDCFSDIPERESFQDAIAFLQSFIKEEVCIAVLMHGHIYRGSSPVQPGEEIDFPKFVRPFDKMYVRSWKSSHDYERPIPN